MIHENLGVTTVRTTLIAPTFLELARSYWFDASEVDTSVLFEMSLEVWLPRCRGVVSYRRQEDDVVKVSFGCHIEMREFFVDIFIVPDMKQRGVSYAICFYFTPPQCVDLNMITTGAHSLC